MDNQQDRTFKELLDDYDPSNHPQRFLESTRQKLAEEAAQADFDRLEQEFYELQSNQASTAAALAVVEQQLQLACKKLGHVYELGVCEHCGYIDPDYGTLYDGEEHF